MLQKLSPRATTHSVGLAAGVGAGVAAGGEGGGDAGVVVGGAVVGGVVVVVGAAVVDGAAVVVGAAIVVVASVVDGASVVVGASVVAVVVGAPPGTSDAGVDPLPSVPPATESPLPHPVNTVATRQAPITHRTHRVTAGNITPNSLRRKASNVLP